MCSRYWLMGDFIRFHIPCHYSENRNSKFHVRNNRQTQIKSWRLPRNRKLRVASNGDYQMYICPQYEFQLCYFTSFSVLLFLLLLFYIIFSAFLSNYKSFLFSFYPVFMLCRDFLFIYEVDFIRNFKKCILILFILICWFRSLRILYFVIAFYKLCDM